MRALDIEAVQAFVLAADLQSFTRAAEAMETTQSAVSLKIKRLEHELGRRLLERTPRRVRLSADGQVFLAAARSLVAAHQGAVGSFDIEQQRLVVGISHHAVGTELPGLLRRLNASNPGVVVELRVAASNEVLADFDRGAVDAAIVFRHDVPRRDGELILTEPFGWMASPDFKHRPGEPLRLATQAEPCSVRSMAIAALDKVGMPWTEVFIGGGVATIGAAISAGLAVAALGRRVAPPGTVDIGPRLGLPPLPTRELMLYTRLTDLKTRQCLSALSAAIRATEIKALAGAARSVPSQSVQKRRK